MSCEGCNCNKPVEVFFYSEKDERNNSIQDMEYATALSACVDIKCKEDFTVPPGETVMVGTGLYVSLPDDYELQIRPRSGISAKTFLIFKNTIGTIDADYRGREIFVLWHNLGSTPVSYEAGSRIAQAKVERVPKVKFIEVDSVENLKAMGQDRGGGFGSTGIK